MAGVSIGWSEPNGLWRLTDIGVTVYGDTEVSRRLEDLVRSYDIWSDRGFVNIPPDQWLTIPLKDGWESSVLKHAKVYPLGPKDREVVDETFR